MDVRLSVLLTCVCLLAINNHAKIVLGRLCWDIYLREIIRMLDNFTKQEVPCGENVANIFENTMFTASTNLVNLTQPQVQNCMPLSLEKKKIEILCQAAAVIKTTACTKYLKGVYLNLQKLTNSKVLCPVKAGNHIKLKHFLEKLQDFSKSIMKEKSHRS